MPRERDPTPLSDLMEKVRPKGKLDDPHTPRVFGAWASLVPRRVAENARPVQLRRGVLVVHTATSAWSNVLSLEGGPILAALHTRLPDVPVKKLLFRVGPLPPLKLPPEKPAAPALPPLAELPDAVARALARIGDDELRASVARAAALGLRRARS
jgi:predicted nucleic acid-binding Zn ribbon protein